MNLHIYHWSELAQVAKPIEILQFREDYVLWHAIEFLGSNFDFISCSSFCYGDNFEEWEAFEQVWDDTARGLLSCETCQDGYAWLVEDMISMTEDPLY